jgi:diketogulonate reductase-like aldo/keto reductase
VPATTSVRTTALPSGEQVPVLGQGTWRLGEGRRDAAVEIETQRLGLDLGMTLVDTAAMYGDGAAEELVGEAIAGRRDEVFLVGKVVPHHATAEGTAAACEASLRRLRTDRLDLYLLHWRGRVPLTETLGGFGRLLRTGRIRHWGVSNFHVADLAELVRLAGGDQVATDQALYSLAFRDVEHDVLPWCLEAGLPLMAYSPLEHGRLLDHPCVVDVATRHGATPAQVAIAWVLRHEHVIAIAQTGSPEHVRENRAAADLRLTAPDLADLDDAFPQPLWAGRPKAY